MANNVKVNLQFAADTTSVTKQLNQLYTQLQHIQNVDFFGNKMDADLTKAADAAKVLQQCLQNAVNVDTGKLDLNKFNSSLQSAGTNVASLGSKLLNAGTNGTAAFTSLARSIASAEVPIKRINSTLSNVMTTLKNTIKWELSSSLIHGLESSFSSAISYVEHLNNALNDIQIVTGNNIEQMEKFAEMANKSAKSLSTTTESYTKAALIFYQQGLDDSAVKARTDAVIKMANVTKDAATDVSSYMTAIWNNFDDGSTSLERYADVITALGASTASSSAEIAAGLEKFASIGKTIGLSYDYATSALATIVANTRQSADTVGTGLRTIFSRLQGLKLGETLEDGVDLNKYSKALKAVGVEVLTMTGDLRSADDILTDLAGKWDLLTTAQQTALAQTVGGVRQYTNLIALMNNWGDMEKNLKTAASSEGTLQKQNDIYVQSFEAAQKRLKASMESLYSNLIDDQALIGLNNTLEKIVSTISSVVKSFGGLEGILTGLGSVALNVFENQIVQSINKMSTSLNKTKTDAETFKQTYTDQTKLLSGFMDDTRLSDSQKLDLQYTTEIMKAQQQLQANSGKLTESQISGIQGVIQQLEAERDQYVSLMKIAEQSAKQQTIDLRKNEATVNPLHRIATEQNSMYNWMSQDQQNSILNNIDNTILADILTRSTQSANELSAVLNGLNIPEDLNITLSGTLGKIQSITSASAQASNALAVMGKNGLTSDPTQFDASMTASGKDLSGMQTGFLAVLNGIQLTGLDEFDTKIEALKQKLSQPLDKGGLLDAIKEFENLNLDLGKYDSFIEKFKQIGSQEGFLDPKGFDEWLNRIREATPQVQQLGDSAKESGEKASKSIKDIINQQNDLTRSIVQIASGLTGLNTLFNTIKNSSATLFSSSASGSEKFGAAISTITGLLYGYVAANKLLVGILGEKKVAELASAGSSLKAAAAEISAAFASGVLTGAQKLLAIAIKGVKAAFDSLSANPVVAALMAIVAVAALAVSAFNGIQEASKESAEAARTDANNRLQAIEEETAAYEKNSKKIRSTYGDFAEAERKRKESGEASSEYISIVDSVLESLGLEELKVLAVTGQYDRLAAAIKAANEERKIQSQITAQDNYKSALSNAHTLFTNYDVSDINTVSKIGNQKGYYYLDNGAKALSEGLKRLDGNTMTVSQVASAIGMTVDANNNLHIKGNDANSLITTYELMEEFASLHPDIAGLQAWQDIYAIIDATGGAAYRAKESAAISTGELYASTAYKALKPGGADYSQMYTDIGTQLQNSGYIQDINSPQAQHLIHQVMMNYFDSLGDSFNADLAAITVADLNLSKIQVPPEIIAEAQNRMGNDFYEYMAAIVDPSSLDLTNADAFINSLTLQGKAAQAWDKYQQVVDLPARIQAEYGNVGKYSDGKTDTSGIESIFHDIYGNGEEYTAAIGNFYAASAEGQLAMLQTMAQGTSEIVTTAYNNAKDAAEDAGTASLAYLSTTLEEAKQNPLLSTIYGDTTIDTLHNDGFITNGRNAISAAEERNQFLIKYAHGSEYDNETLLEDYLQAHPEEDPNIEALANEVRNYALFMARSGIIMSDQEVIAKAQTYSEDYDGITIYTSEQIQSAAESLNSVEQANEAYSANMQQAADAAEESTTTAVIVNSTAASNFATLAGLTSKSSMTKAEAWTTLLNSSEPGTTLESLQSTYDTSSDSEWGQIILDAAKNQLDKTISNSAFNALSSEDQQTNTKQIISDSEYAALTAQYNQMVSNLATTQFNDETRGIQESLSIAKEYQSILSSIKLDSLATMGNTELTRFINTLKQAKKEYKDLTKEEFLQKTQLEQITMIAEAQAEEYKNQSDIYADLAKKAGEYADKATTDEEKATWQAKQIEYQNLATQALIDSENAVTQSITDKIKVYEAAIDRLQKAENVDKQNAEKSKSTAEILTGAIETGALTEAQKTLLKSNGFDLDASGWNEAADATTRAAIAAKAWSTYASNIQSYGDELVATYNGAAEAVEKLNDNIQKTVIGDKTNLPQLLTDNNITDEVQVGALLKAWDSLIAKGKEASSITLADLAAEARSMGTIFTAEVDAAVAASTDAMNSIFHQMAQQHIASAQAAADAWKDAFTQIASFRKSLLEGDDILSQIAGNPEAFAQGLASYRKTYPNASAQQFYAAVANGNVKASDLKYTDFDINQYMADTGRSFATKEHSIYSGTHFGTIIDENAMPSWAKTDKLRVGQMRIRDAQALVDNGQASDFDSAKAMLNDWYTAAFKKMVKEDGTAYTDNEIGELVTRIQQGDIEAYRLLSTGLDRIEDYAEITADASRLNTARQEATSALQGVQNDTTRTAEFRGQQRTESELNNLNAAINAAQKIKEQEGRWEDIDANSRRILEENGITSFDGLSGAATDCAGALAVLAGAAEAAAQAQLGKVGTYKNGDEYGQILDKDGNLVQLKAGPDGKYDAAGFLAKHEGKGYTFNADQATTTAMSTMATTTQTALDTETDTKQSEILSEAKLAGFSSKEEQEEYIRLAVERNEIASAEEMIEQGICETKEEALELQREYANQLKKCERGLKSLADNGKKWVKTVKDATASISDQATAMKGLRQGYKDILNLSDSAAEALNAEFLTNSEMLKLAETAASDSGTKGQQALNKLQAAAAAAITPFDDMEVGLDKIAQAIADVNLQAGDLFADADYSMVDNYWNTVVDKCLASGDTIGQAVETANAALNGLGVDVNPQLEIVTETLDPAGFQAILEKTGTKTVTVPDGVGGTREVTYDEFKQIYEEAGSTSIPFTYVKGKGAPGANKYTKRAEKPGGGGGGRGGGGGGRGRDPRRANKINKKDNIERYHEIDNVIDDLADAYKRLNKEEERAWGKNRINAMQQETKILKDQIAAVEEKIRQAREWKDKDLSAALSAGWTFDSNGNVNNYDEFLNSQIDKYNAAIDSYNAMSADAQEELDKKYKDMTNKDGEYYSSYEDYLKKTLIDDPKEALEQYEETMELLEDLGIEYDDFLNSWHDNIIGQIQTKLDTTLEITEAQLGYLEHKLSRIEDDAYSAAEAIGLMGQQMDIAQAQFNAQKSALDNLLKAYSPEGTVWSAEDLINGNISIKDLVNAGMQSGDIKLIQTIMEGLMDASEQMSGQMSSSIEHMANAFEEFNSDMDRYISTVEHAQTITSTYRNIIDLTGRTMSRFNSTMLKSINDAIAAQSVAKLATNKTKYETIKTQYDEAKAAYEAAQTSYAEGGIDAAALKAAKDTYQAAQDNMNEAQEAFLSSWEEALQAAADAFQSNMEAAVRDVGEMMSGGLAGGLAELEDAFAKMNEQDQNYVDDYEKIYQLTKMTRDLNDKIDSTSNVRAQKELLKYQKELNGLLESDQEMSSYDLDYLQKKLDLKLAEIALDEAQNAKSQVTMRRDSEGNYNYVYTADENAVEKAESEYANKLYEMQKANDEYITNLSENMANLSSQMLNEISAIDTTIYDTEEKYQAEVQRITDHYTTQMEYYNSEMNKVLDNNKILYEQDWTNFNKYTGYKISAEENYVTRWNQTVLSQVTGFETQEEFYENFNKAVFGEDPAHPSGESLIGRLVTAYKSMRDQITAANAAAGVETEDLATALLGNIEAATQEAEAAADGITDAATEIVDQITSIGDAVTDMVNNYSQAMATMEAQTDAMLGVLLDFLTAYGEIGNLNIEPGVLAEIEARRRERQENPEGFDTGGYTGAWGSEGRLAYLHQKELVLNAEDTVNMLTSVGILRQIASIIDLNALASAGGFISLMSSGVGGNQGTLQQEVHIEASFPAVTDKNQIEEAFGDLVNLAAQYANRRV